MEDVIMEEINVKQIEYVADESAIIKKKSKPNFKSLGPKFGKSVQPIAARLRDLTSEEISRLQSQGSLVVHVNGTEYTIDTNDVEICMKISGMVGGNRRLTYSCFRYSLDR